MDAETFAAERGERLETADEELKPFVRAMLTRWGDDDFDADLLEAAGVLWLEIYQAEAPSSDPADNLAAYQAALHEALLETSDPEALPEESQVDRVTQWVSTFTANDATWRGTAVRGGKFTRWITQRDGAVRETHREADGQVRPVGGTFDIGGHRLHYPGEPVGPPEIWINCRCLIQSAAREGEAMSSTTIVVGPEDGIEDDNPDIIPGSDAFSTVDVDTEPLPEIDEEDMVPDEPEDGEELITEIPVHGVLAPEGVSTGDGRKFAIGALSTRTLPIPLRYETVGTHGGQTSDVVTVGRIDEAWRDDATAMWRFRGAVVLNKPFAQDVIDGLVDGTVRGTSIDGDDAEVEINMGDPEDADENGEIDLLEALFNPGETVYSKMRVAGLTIVPIPAFQEAYIALGHEFQEDMTDAEVEAEVAALQACGCLDGWNVVDLSDSPEANARAALEAELFRDVPQDERDRRAEDGTAMPDGSYPIGDCDDLRNAIQSIGRANDPDAVKAHIKRRKSALGCEEVELPEDWGALAETFAPGTHDGPGWITHPIPTARIRNYWTHGEGAAKIKWGVPGDFNRCRTQLAKYVANPDWLAGMCANMHKEALDIWPAQHHGSRVLTASASVLRSDVARLVEPESPVYPDAWFQNPGLDRAVPLRIERDTRRTYGYIAEWGTCHVGMAGFCQDVPHSMTDYGYFLKGVVDTDAGEQYVGCLTFGGHASRFASMSAASEFYDKPDAVRAFVNVGEDEFGIWFAGIIPPDVTDADITKMRAIGAVSGDWREIRGQLELIGVPIVNTPGFPQRVLAASAGVQTVLIGAGALKPEPALIASATIGLDPELVAGIARTAVAEYRHQEKLAERAAPQRQKVRQRRLESARARANRE